MGENISTEEMKLRAMEFEHKTLQSTYGKLYRIKSIFLNVFDRSDLLLSLGKYNQCVSWLISIFS